MIRKGLILVKQPTNWFFLRNIVDGLKKDGFHLILRAGKTIDTLVIKIFSPLLNKVYIFLLISLKTKKKVLPSQLRKKTPYDL